MPVLTLGPKSDFVALESDWYTLTLLSYEIREKEADKFHKKPYQDVQFQWEVTVPGEEPTERRSWANVPASFNEKSKLVEIGIALGAIDPAAGADGLDIDLDTWLGKKCRGNIVEITKPNGDLSDKIDGYAPYRAPRGAAKPASARRAAPPPPVDDDPDGDMPF